MSRPFAENRARWASATVAVSLLLAWELLAARGALSRVFFPTPSALAAFLVRDGVLRELAAHAAATLGRIAVGLPLGAIPGLALGIAMGRSAWVRAFVDPFVAALHPVPKIALLPLALIAFGIGNVSVIALVALAAFFPVLIGAMAGVRQISPIHFEVARNYRAGRSLAFFRVLLPGCLPSTLAGTRVAMNNALMVATSVEMIGGKRGLGSLLWHSWETLRLEWFYLGLAVLSLVGLGLNLLLARASRRLLRWMIEPEI